MSGVRRADARRSRASILDAAVRLLNTHPDASIEAIANAAGVTRQTVYAHFPSRTNCWPHSSTGSPRKPSPRWTPPASTPDLLRTLRLLDASSGTAGRYLVLLQKIDSLSVSPQADTERHAPVAGRVQRVIQRGQETGEFDGRLSPDWLVTVTITLGHAAGREVDAGRMTDAQAAEALHTSLLRVLGAER